MKTWEISEAAEMKTVAKEVLNAAAETKADRAVVVTLQGDLGAGKTTFTQALAHELGVTETVTSPTFVIMKRYPAASHYKALVHIDAYRIETVDEMRVLGFADLLAEKDTIICIEWPEHIRALIPESVIKLAITITDTGRTITMEAVT